MEVINDIKTLLSLGDSHDQILNICVSEADRRVLARIDDETVPTELTHVVRYVAITLYNRLGSEGVSSESDAVGTVTYIDINDVLDQFSSDLRRYGTSKKRLVVI